MRVRVCEINCACHLCTASSSSQLTIFETRILGKAKEKNVKHEKALLRVALDVIASHGRGFSYMTGFPSTISSPSRVTYLGGSRMPSCSAPQVLSKRCNRYSVATTTRDTSRRKYSNALEIPAAHDDDEQDCESAGSSTMDSSRRGFGTYAYPVDSSSFLLTTSALPASVSAFGFL